MNIAPKLIYNVVIFFALMVPGIILKKCKLVPDGFGKGLSNLVLYVAQPVLVFLAYVRPYDPSVLINALWVLLFSVIAHVLFTLVAMLCFKSAPDAIRRMLRFATIFSNAAFMGIPLIEEVLPGATLYASIYNITFNLFLWTLGVKICTEHRDVDGDGVSDAAELRKKGGEASLLKALIHPVTIAAALGLVVFFTPLSELMPEIVTDGLGRIKALVAPLSMTVIGLRLADMDLRGFFRNKDLYIFLALRHFLLPAAVFAIMRLLVFAGVPLSSEVMACVLILAATPSASSSTMFAEKYDCDAAYVSKLVAISTILSLASMPIIALLLQI